MGGWGGLAQGQERTQKGNSLLTGVVAYPYMSMRSSIAQVLKQVFYHKLVSFKHARISP